MLVKKRKERKIIVKNWIYSERLLNIVDSILDLFIIDVYIN